MSTDRDATRIVRSWLEEGADRIPDRVLDAVEASLPATPQRRAGWLARRFPNMNTTTFRFGVAAAAVILLAVVGWRYLPVSDVGVEPQPTPTPTPTPVAALNGQQELAAGTYRGVLPGFSLGFTITVPEGWTAIGQRAVGAPNNDPPDLVHSLLFWNVENLYADPLAPDEGLLDPQVGPTVDDLVDALVDHDGWTTTTPTDVTIGGYTGKMLELTVPPDADFDGCGATGGTTRPFAIWKEPGGESWRCMQGPGQTDRVYVVDVDGERLVITLVGYPDWSGTYLENLEAMVDSLEFTRR